jgi:hypothetical protein
MAIAPPIHQQTCAAFWHEKLPGSAGYAVVIGTLAFEFDM